MRRVFGVFLFVLIGVGAFSQVDSVSLASEWIDNFQYRKAQQLLERITEQEPYNVIAIRKKAFCEFQLGSIKAAKSTFNKAFLFDSSHIQTIYYIGVLSEKEGDVSSALGWYQRLLKLDSTNSIYLKLCANASKSLRNQPLQIEYLEKALRYNEDDQQVIQELLSYYASKASLEYKADSLVHVAIVKDSTILYNYQVRSRIYYRQGCFDLALQDIEIMEKDFADTTPVNRRLKGYCYYRMNEWSDMINTMEPLLESDPERRENTHYYLAMANQKINNDDLALYHFKKCVEEGTSELLSTYYSNIGELYLMQQDQEKAIKSFKMAAEFGDSPSVIFRLAQYADMNEKDKPKAIALYQKYLTTPDSVYRKFVEDRVLYLNK